MQRSLLLFENSVRSPKTYERYIYYLNRFKKFYILKDYDSIVAIPIEKLQIMIEDYVMDLKKKVSPNSVGTYMAGLEAFFETNDVEIRWKKIRRLYPAKIKKTGTKPWTTEEIQLMLQSTRDVRQKTLIHFLAASGVRRGAIPELKLKHITDIQDGCKSVLVYEDSLEEYTTFIHSEASTWLDRYLDQRKNDGEVLTADSPLFRKSYQIGQQKTESMDEELVLKSMIYVVNKSGLRTGQQKRSGRYETQTDHGFRKRWVTIMENTEGMNIVLAEKMIGHSIKSIPRAQEYNVPTIDVLFKEYQKGIPELVIDDSSRKQAELDKVNQEKSQLQVQIEESDMQKDEIARQSQSIDYLMNEMKKLKNNKNP